MIKIILLLLLSILSFLVGGYDILGTLLGTYPGLLFHKAFVNKGSKLPMLDNRTNDPSGRTFDMKIGKRTFNVPRSTWKTRIAFAIISIIIVLATHKHVWIV